MLKLYWYIFLSIIGVLVIIGECFSLAAGFDWPSFIAIVSFLFLLPWWICEVIVSIKKLKI